MVHRVAEPRLFIPGPSAEMRRALETLRPHDSAKVAIPPGWNPHLLVPGRLRPPDTSEMDFIQTYITGSEVLGWEASEAQLLRTVKSLPTEWVVSISTRIIAFIENRTVSGQNLQEILVNEFAPSSMREGLLALVRQGRIFMYEEQLLGVIRLAIEHGGDETDASRWHLSLLVPRYIDALLMFSDLHGAERPSGESTREELTAFALRSLAFQTHEAPRNLIARADAYWFTVPPLLKGLSKNFVDVLAVFRGATGVELSDHIAAVVGMIAHVLGTVGRAQKEKNWDDWVVVPKADGFFRNARNPAVMARALRRLSADRSEFRSLFKSMPERPRFAGVAQWPFRQYPLYRFANGNVVVLNPRYLTDQLISGVVWSVSSHLEARGGKSSRLRFRRFFGEIFERYVFEVVSSCFDLPGFRRTYGERDIRVADRARDHRGSDAAVFLSDKALFFEATVTGLHFMETLLAASLTDFDRDTSASVIKKTKQVERAIAAYREGLFRYPAPHDGAQRWNLRVWPIVVLQEPMPTFSLLSDRIARGMRSAGAGNNNPAAEVLSIDDLESCLRPNADGSLTDLITAKRSTPGTRALSFRNFLNVHGREDAEIAPFVDDSYRRTWNRVLTVLDIDPPKPVEDEVAEEERL